MVVSVVFVSRVLVCFLVSCPLCCCFLMKIISWNCQRAASKRFMRAAMHFIKKYRPSCFCLLETKMSGQGAGDVCFRLGFDHWIRVEAVGMSGGIWVLWKDELNITVIRTHPQFMLFNISDHKRNTWDMAVVYGSPSNMLRRKLWRDLRSTSCGIQDRWIAIGDFNAVACVDEVSCPGTYTEHRSRDFNNWVSNEGLVDMGYVGSRFTWRRGVNERTFRGARLDRGLGSVEWLEMYPCTKITHLPAMKSDHTPLLLSFDENDNLNRSNRFRFQAAWTTHEDFRGIVEKAWSTGRCMEDKINETRKALKHWNINSSGNIHKKKRRLEARLQGIQCVMDSRRNASLIKLESKLRKELEDVLYQEELLWFQQSKEEWIKSGDRNTKFYHAATRVRRATGNIHALLNDDGGLDTEEEIIQNRVFTYFDSMFKGEEATFQVRPIPKGFPDINDQVHSFMCRELTKDEVRAALFEMAPYKAPGLDGFRAGFYQSAWDTVGNDITEMVKQFLNMGNLQEGLNDTLITLIPKVKNPDKVSHFRPISLCNVLYKLITKVIANRLKGFLNKAIGREQSSFVPQRQIIDNIVVYQEALHSMRMKKGNMGYMVLKIDLEKAYDRLLWNFLHDTLQEVGLNDHWVENIMKCVRTPNLAILWNGNQLDWIKPRRGIRQGDPMSPYLFVLCMEKLSHIIKAEVTQGRWCGLKISRYGPVISHLFFADDMVLFAEATEEQMGTIKRCLNLFEEASGQKVSLQKSQMFFSNNVDPEKANRIAEIVGITRTTDLGRYLGVPSVHGRVTTSLFAPLIERIESKLQGWKKRYLLLAGRRTLVMSVLSAIPYYSMQTFNLPVGLCDEIEKRLRNFLWGDGIHLVSWDKVMKEKKEGGLGIRSLRSMNLAFLAKLGWRLTTQKDALWMQVLQAKYRNNASNEESFIGNQGASNLWKGICKAEKILKQGTRKVVRSGKNTSFWYDRWLRPDPLTAEANITIPEDESKKCVAEYWTTEGTWDWDTLADLLPESVLKDLNRVILFGGDTEVDDVYWDKESSGEFSVSSAYNIQQQTTKHKGVNDWDIIWSLNVPNRVCMFLWLLKHGRILCNTERKRRGLTMNANCDICHDREEDLDHIFRKCKRAKGIWAELIPACDRRMLDSLSFDTWFTKNIRGKTQFDTRINWGHVFATAMWWLWRWRNEVVFKNHEREQSKKIKWIIQQSHEAARAFAKAKTPGVISKGPGSEQTMRQEFPKGWTLINTDACFNSENDSTGCGGVMRNDEGEWVAGFSCMTKVNNSSEAECWALMQAVKWAWSKGCKKVWFQSDSKEIVGWLNSDCDPRGPLGDMIGNCRRWLNKPWEVKISYLPRLQHGGRLSCQNSKDEEMRLDRVCHTPRGCHLYDPWKS